MKSALLCSDNGNNFGNRSCHDFAVPARKPQLVADLHGKPAVQTLGLTGGCVPDKPVLENNENAPGGCA